MSETNCAMTLLRDGVPLALLIDLAGLGLPSEELYAEEERSSFLAGHLSGLRVSA